MIFRVHHLLRAGTLCVWFSLHAGAQLTFVPFGETSPQAKTRQELDAFGKIYDATDPASVIRLGESFLEHYPDSEFLQFARAPLLHAYEQMGQPGKVRDTALMILGMNPDNPDALLALAAYRLKYPDAPGQKLLTAHQYAQHAVEKVSGFKAPVTANRSLWVETKQRLLGRAYMLLGLAAAAERKMDEAIASLALATEIDPRGEYFYRLSLVQESAGHAVEALAAALRARDLGPEQVSLLAGRAIARLRRTDVSRSK